MKFLVSSDVNMKSCVTATQELGDILQWIKLNLGIRVENTRIKKYYEYLSSKEKIESLADYNKYQLTAREIEDFFLIYKSFGCDDSSSSLNEKIKKTISGKEFRCESALVDNDPSRDFLHELSIAARFKNSGYIVDIDSECDVVMHFDDKTIFIECKRVKSERKLFLRLKSASKQINRRIGFNQKNKYGYIFLDITDLVVLDRNVEFFSNKEYLIQSFHLKLSFYVNKLKDKIRNYVGRETIGVVFCVNGCGVISDGGNDKILSCTVMYGVGCENGNKKLSQLNIKILGSLC